jgi:hypothetical protein
VTDASTLSFEIAGFKLTVVGRQFPDSQDFWDGNWLNVRCECKASGARVEAQGPLVHLSEIAEILNGLDALSEGNCKRANVDFIESELGFNFEVGSRGDIKFEVRLTPNILEQSHKFNFAIDLSYLPSAIGQCKAILEAYPMRDSVEQSSPTALGD